jgi:hypothetical protein
MFLIFRSTSAFSFSTTLLSFGEPDVDPAMGGLPFNPPPAPVEFAVPSEFVPTVFADEDVFPDVLEFGGDCPAVVDGLEGAGIDGLDVDALAGPLMPPGLVVPGAVPDIVGDARPPTLWLAFAAFPAPAAPAAPPELIAPPVVAPPAAAPPVPPPPAPPPACANAAVEMKRVVNTAKTLMLFMVVSQSAFAFNSTATRSYFSFDAFSSREPGPTSLENAPGTGAKRFTRLMVPDAAGVYDATRPGCTAQGRSPNRRR